MPYTLESLHTAFDIKEKETMKALILCCSILVLLLLQRVLSEGDHERSSLSPRGWDSYDSYSWIISADEFLQNAKLVARRLKTHGYEYVVLDLLRFRKKVKGAWLDSVGYNVIDEWGRVIPDPDRWPSSNGGKGFAEVAERIHNMDLKFRLHVMNGISTQAMNTNTLVLAPGIDVYGGEENVYKQQYERKVHLLASTSVDFCLDASPNKKLAAKDFDTHFLLANQTPASQMRELNDDGTLKNGYSGLRALVEDNSKVRGIRSWVANRRKGEIYVTFFYLEPEKTMISAKLADPAKYVPGISSKNSSCSYSEVWSGRDSGQAKDMISAVVKLRGYVPFGLNFSN